MFKSGEGGMVVPLAGRILRSGGVGMRRLRIGKETWGKCCTRRLEGWGTWPVGLGSLGVYEIALFGK